MRKGQIATVQYAADGTVLSFSQPLLDDDGGEIGTTWTETDRGRGRRRAQLVAEARKHLRITSGQARTIMGRRRHTDGADHG